ncbi:MAG: TSUP family transporter [Desulfobacterales bacterium]|nr:TSUP family transporter [Desulfobacterales bacterium]
MDLLSWHIYIILWFAGLLAGFVDSIAGGGGLISLSALLSVGIPPHLALGTNKLQSSFGSFTAAMNYSRNGLVSFRDILPGIVFTAIGASLGTIAIQHITADILKHIIPGLLFAIFLFILFSPELGTKDQIAKIRESLFYGIFGLVLGFYDGFFGPGTGTFWAMGFVLILGLNLKRATAYTKVVNFTSNIISLIVFILGNHVLFIAGMVMGIGQAMGAVMGSNLVVIRGIRFIRVFLLTVVALTIMNLIYTTYF